MKRPNNTVIFCIIIFVANYCNAADNSTNSSSPEVATTNTNSEATADPSTKVHKPNSNKITESSTLQENSAVTAAAITSTLSPVVQTVNATLPPIEEKPKPTQHQISDDVDGQLFTYFISILGRFIQILLDPHNKPSVTMHVTQMVNDVIGVAQTVTKGSNRNEHYNTEKMNMLLQKLAKRVEKIDAKA